MTRADDLLAELRGAMAVRDAHERLRSAAADLDAFMSVFGVLPKEWRVRLSSLEDPGGPAVRAQVAAKLGVIVRDSMAEAGYFDQALAGAVARDLVEAILEEYREGARLQRYWSVYGELEIAGALEEDSHGSQDG